MKTYTKSEIQINYDTHTAHPLVPVNGLYPSLEPIYLKDGTSIWYDPNSTEFNIWWNKMSTSKLGIWLNEAVENPFRNPINFVVFIVFILLIYVVSISGLFIMGFILAGIVFFLGAVYSGAGTFLSGLFNKK